MVPAYRGFILPIWNLVNGIRPYIGLSYIIWAHHIADMFCHHKSNYPVFKISLTEIFLFLLGLCYSA